MNRKKCFWKFFKDGYFISEKINAKTFQRQLFTSLMCTVHDKLCDITRQRSKFGIPETGDKIKALLSFKNGSELAFSCSK